MAATADPPLQLTDIVHVASPFSETNESAVTHPNSLEDAETEPLNLADISTMRSRLAELGFEPGSRQIETTSLEKELAEMVFRLTESPLVDPTQLIHQANTISDLTSQRDYLIRQNEEEKKLWESQRDDWQRMAEVLIAQRNKQLNSSPKDPELDRLCSALESDNRALRDKLHDTQHRLQALEAELGKLKPILLMQPFATTQSSLASIQHASSFLSSLPYPSSGASIPPKQKSKRKKVEQRDTTEHTRTDRGSQPSETSKGQSTSEQSSARSSFLQFQAAPAPNQQQPRFSGDHYRRPTTPSVGGPLTTPPTTLSFQLNPQIQGPAPFHVTPAVPACPVRQPPSTSTSTATATHSQAGSSTLRNTAEKVTQPPRSSALASSSRNGKTKSASSIAIHPLSADARSEHLLLAARKIGRERAGIVVGYLRSRQADTDAQNVEGEKSHESHTMADKEPQPDRPTSHYRETVNGAGAPFTPKQSVNASKQISDHPPIASSASRPSSHASSSSDKESLHASGDAPRALQNPVPIPGPSTPRLQPRKAHSTQPEQPTPTPTTSFTSLLDAARMMDIARSNATTSSEPSTSSSKPQPIANGHGRGRRRGAASIEQAESPPTKRRRVNSARGSSSMVVLQPDKESNHQAEEVKQRDATRVRSALDVLADQAAAFSSTSRDPELSSRNKGKEKVVGTSEVTDLDGAQQSTEKASKAPKARVKAKPKPKAPPKSKERQAEPKSKRATRGPPKERVPTTRSAQKEGSLRSSPVSSRIIKTAAHEPRMISPPDAGSSLTMSIQSVAPELPHSAPATPNERGKEDIHTSAPSPNPSQEEHQSERLHSQSPTTSIPDSRPNFSNRTEPNDILAVRAKEPSPPTETTPPKRASQLRGISPSAANRIEADDLTNLRAEQISPSDDPVIPSPTEKSDQLPHVDDLQTLGHSNPLQNPVQAQDSPSDSTGTNVPASMSTNSEAHSALPSSFPLAGLNSEPHTELSPDVLHDEMPAEQGSFMPVAESTSQLKGPFPTETFLSTPHSPQFSELTSNPGSRATEAMAVDLEHDAEHKQVGLPRTSSTDIRAANPQRDPKSGGLVEDPDAEGDLDAEGEEDAEGEVDSEAEVSIVPQSAVHHDQAPQLTADNVEGNPMNNP